MADAKYSVYLSDPFGVRLADASGFVSLKYSRVVNDVGTAVLVLPEKDKKGRPYSSLFRAPDGRIEIWRRLPGSDNEYLDTETTWLIKKVVYDHDDRGRTTIIIEADTPLCLLREPGRFVNYNASAPGRSWAPESSAFFRRPAALSSPGRSES